MTSYRASSWLPTVACVNVLILGLASSSKAGEAAPRPAQAYGQLPLSFEANHGQADPRVKFLSRGAGYTLLLTDNDAVLSWSKPRLASRNTRLRMSLVRANPRPRIEGLEERSSKVHYLQGNDPQQWRTRVPRYARVLYKDVYRGVDLTYYGTSQGQLEYDFLVSPGSDPRTIGLDFEGADALSLDAQGNLVLKTESGEIVQQRPVMYQEKGGVKTHVDGRLRPRKPTHGSIRTRRL